MKEKIDQIRPELPADVRDIFLFTFNTNDIPIVEGRISAKDMDLSDSYDLIERRVLDRLARRQRRRAAAHPRPAGGVARLISGTLPDQYAHRSGPAPCLMRTSLRSSTR